MQIKEGAYYARRDGKIIGPIERNGQNPDYPWAVITENGIRYTYNNKGWWLDPQHPRGYDLMAEAFVAPDSERQHFEELGRKIQPYMTSLFQCGGRLTHLINTGDSCTLAGAKALVEAYDSHQAQIDYLRAENIRLHEVHRAQAERIVLLSCAPTGTVENAKRLLPAGYAIVKVV
jgi:hypothetical protein